MTHAEQPLWIKEGYINQYNQLRRIRKNPLSVSERRIAESNLLAERERLRRRLCEIQGALQALKTFPEKELHW